MNEPREFTEYLAEISRALRGRGKHRQEILEELRGHLLDEIEDAPISPLSIRRALDRFGRPQVIAGGFNQVLREKRLRFARSALAVAALSMVGGLATQRALAPAGDQISPPAVHAQSAAGLVASKTNVVVIDPTTGEVIRVPRHS
jgi:hypothetical protein